MYELVSVAEGIAMKVSNEFMVLTKCLNDLSFAP